MKIAIDISPLSTGHKLRGTGFYINHLKSALIKYFPEHEYTFFTNKKQIPENVDVVHYPYFEPFIITLPFSKKHKTVVTVLDLIPILLPKHFPRGIKGNIKWQVQKFLLTRVNAIVTCSESSKTDIIKLIHYPKNRIKVAYLAPGEEFIRIKISLQDKKRLQEKYRLPEKFILYVGDATWNKNIPRFIEAVKLTKLPLVLVGKALSITDIDKSNGWNSDLMRVQELTADDKNITKLGFVSTDELVLLYNMATVFVFPSIYEGFGLPVIEAMSCGTPVVTTMESSLPEVGGKAVCYVDGYNTAAIANGIKEVFENEKLRNQLSEAGLSRSKEFSWMKTAAETIAVYKSVL